MATIEKRNRLPNSFFRANPLLHMSAAKIIHFTITELTGSLKCELDNMVEKEIDDAHRITVQQERKQLEATDDPAALVEYARKKHDILNRRLLCEKLLQQHEQTMPLLLKRYRTCALDGFIETATEVLACGEKKYAQQLRDMYADIRAPYARACACLVFGMQAMDEIPFLLHEYERFQREYPEESFEQHPLLALYLLHGKY